MKAKEGVEFEQVQCYILPRPTFRNLGALILESLGGMCCNLGELSLRKTSIACIHDSKSSPFCAGLS